MIFLTIGTLFEFDRLVKAVDEIVLAGLIDEEVFAQIGPGQYQPKSMPSVKTLNKEEYDSTVRQCSALISHAGMGSISMALNHNKPLLVMPRLKKYREHVNDHQLGTARKFEQLGHILAAYEVGQLAPKIKLLTTFVPAQRNPNRQGITDRICEFLGNVSGQQE
jgi:UDP-N-acetylglucosamine transferase subunit ALG13